MLFSQVNSSNFVICHYLDKFCTKDDNFLLYFAKHELSNLVVKKKKKRIIQPETARLTYKTLILYGSNCLTSILGK